MNFVVGWWPYAVHDWSGVRLYPRHEVSRGDDGSLIVAHRPIVEEGVSKGSDFSKLFRTILPKLHSYAWIFDISSFSTLSFLDEEIDQRCEFMLSLKITEELCYCDNPGFLEEWAAAATDDWNRIVGLAAPITDKNSIPGEGTHINPKLVEAAKVVFDNYDGAYWACYSPDKTLIDEVCRHNQNRPDVHVVACTLRETFEIHKQEWDEFEKMRPKPS